jgi:hypothetical protein
MKKLGIQIWATWTDEAKNLLLRYFVCGCFVKVVQNINRLFTVVERTSVSPRRKHFVNRYRVRGFCSLLREKILLYYYVQLW